MVQARIGNNFDIDAITRMVNADANVPATEDKPFIDAVADAFAADVDDMVDELRFNPSSNLAEEAAQILNSPLAAKLGAGVLADLRAAVQLQEEKAANGSDAFMRGDRVWDEREKREEKERKDQAKIADMADDANNTQLSTTPDRYGLSEQNYAELNSELKTRDGQERFMAFLRMMNPGMTGEQIRRRFDDAQIVAAVRSGQATDAQRQAYNGMSDERRDDASTSLAQYEEMGGSRFTPTVANQADAQAVTVSAETATETTTVDASMDILSGGNASGMIVPSRTSLTAQVEGRGDFAATAPSLRDHHRAALTATAPLDQPAPQVIASAPPVAPVPAANAGFDV